MSFSVSSTLNRISTSNVRSLNISIPTTITRTPLVNFWISDWIELLLKKIAVNSLGPTLTTRWLFLACNGIYNSYQYIVDKTPLDSEYWTSNSKGKTGSDDNYIVTWIDNACKYFMPILIRNYMNLSLTDQEINDISNSHTSSVNIDINSFNNLKTLLDAYLVARDNDGWKEAKTYNVSLYNGTSVIYGDNSVDQNLNDLPYKDKWTPLSINGSKKNYLTPGWGTSNKGIVNDTDFKDLIDKTQTLFPTDTQYENEMKDTAEVTANLTDEQKILAEFWAGGPGTVTPPGMWVVFLDIVIRSNNINYLNELKYYTILSSGLYQAGICAWRLKLDNQQARPIQKIRQYLYNQSLTQSWDTHPNNDKGQFWLPYQELTFVTPPFPDFVSGHSTFSSSSAKLLCYLFGTDMINLNNPVINNNILEYLSPVLTNRANFSLNNFYIFPNTSTVENNVPSTAINLNWVCWTEMARSSGKSRIYGGIHVESSNQGGLYLGSMIGDKVWNLLKNI